MASDPSIYNLVGAGVTPLLNPLDVQVKKLQLRNALAAGALQDQQIQQGQLAMQQDADFRARINGAAPSASPAAAAPAPAAPSVVSDPWGNALPGAPAYTPATAPPPNASPAGAGAPPTAAHDIPDDQILGIYGQKGYALIHARNEANKLAADAAESASKTRLANQNYWGSLAYGLDQVGYDPGAVQAALAMAKSNGMERTPEFQLFSANAQNPAALKQFAAQAMANSQEQQTLLNQHTTAGAAALRAQTDAGKETRAATDEAAAKLRSALGAATSQNDWNRIIGGAKPDVVQAVNPPAAFSEANRAAVVQAGLTPDQQVTTAETARRDTATVANEKRARDQEQQNINLRVKAFNQQYGNPLDGASEADLATARMRAAGRLPLPSPRTKGYDRQVALAASLDPTFAQYAGTRFDTVKSFAEKNDANDLVQLATALEHLHLATENSKSMQFEPSLSLNITPAQHRYHQDIYNLTDEVGKLIKSGVVPEHEGKRAIDNLMSAFEANRNAGLDELSQLMGGKVAAKIQKYVNGTGQLLPASMFDKPTQERLKAAGFGNGIDWNAQAAPAAAPAPGAPTAPPAPGPDLSKVPTAELLQRLAH